MKVNATILIAIGLVAGCISAPQRVGSQAADASVGVSLDPACSVQDITRTADGLVVWSATGDQYMVNKKDSNGVYQMYVGAKGRGVPACITCSAKANAPA